jgi:hypothetical protein
VALQRMFSDCSVMLINLMGVLQLAKMPWNTVSCAVPLRCTSSGIIHSTGDVSSAAAHPKPASLTFTKPHPLILSAFENATNTDYIFAEQCSNFFLSTSCSADIRHCCTVGSSINLFISPPVSLL